MLETSERPSPPRAPTGGWTWRQVPGVPPKRRGQPRPLLKVLPGVAVALLFWWLGHPVGAAVLGVVLVVLGVALAVSPTAARGFERLLKAVERIVGSVLGVVLMGAVELLVFTPVAAIMRLFRHDPMALGARADDPTFWRPSVRTKRRLYHRQFTDERVVGVGAPGAPRVGTFFRVRALIGLVVILLVADVATGEAINTIERALGRDTETTPTVLGSAPWRVAAGEDEPWAPQLFPTVHRLINTAPLHPLRGWTINDAETRYVHEEDGIRRSYEPADVNSPDALDVFFLGGSTTWGAYQRDEHTIPSEFARRAEEAGIPVRVTNYATPGYAIWQEVELLQELLTAGKVPDLVVFYDGVNELIVQSVLGPTDEPTHYKRDEIVQAYRNYNANGDRGFFTDRVATEYTDRSAVYRAFSSIRNAIRGKGFTAVLPQTIWSGTANRVDLADDRARDAVEIHRRGVEVAQRLAASYGVQTAFYWQPNYYTKTRVRAEDNIPGNWAEDPDAWRVASRVARQELQAPVVDLGDAWDDVREPIMYDFHHSNELGAHVMAGAIFDNLRGRLEGLEGERG